MADIIKRNQPTIQPPVPERPMFDINSIITAPELTDATIIHNNAITQLDEQKLTSDLNALEQQNMLSNQTVQKAKEIYSDNSVQTKRITGAQNRRAQIEKIPPAIGRILGLFSTDYDWTYWNEEVRAGKIALATNEDQLNQLTQMNKLHQDVIANQMTMVQAQYNNISSGFDRALAVRQTAQEESNRKFTQALQLAEEARAGVRFQWDKQNQARVEQQYTVGGLSDEELATGVAKGMEGIPAGLLLKEQRERTRTRQDIVSASQAIAANDLALAKSIKADIIGSWSAQELTDAAERAAEQGGVVLQALDAKGNKHEVRFEAAELRDAAVIRMKTDQSSEDYLTDVVVKTATAANDMNAATVNALRISRATGANGILPQAQSIITNANIKVQAAQATGNHSKVAEFASEASVAMNKLVDDTINSYPKNSQQFVRDQFEDRASSLADLTNFLGDALYNPSAMVNPVDQKLSPFRRRISDEVNRLAKTAMPSIASGEDVSTSELIASTFGSKITNRGQLVATALGNLRDDTVDPTTNQIIPGLRSQFAGMRDAGAIQTAINELSDMNLPWTQGLRSTVQFTDAAGNVDTYKLMSFLRDRYNADLEAGRIPMVMAQTQGGGVVPYDRQFIEYMMRPEFQQKIATEYGTYSLEGNATFQLINGGDPLDNYLTNLYSLEANFDRDYAASKQQERQIMRTPDKAQFSRTNRSTINTRAQKMVQENPGMSLSKAMTQVEDEMYSTFLKNSAAAFQGMQQ